MLETIGLIGLYVFIAGIVLLMLGLGASARKNYKVNRQHPWLDSDTGVNLIPIHDGFVEDEHGEPVARTRMAARPSLTDLVKVVMNAPRPSRDYPNQAPTATLPVQVPRAYTLPTPPPQPVVKTQPQTFVPVSVLLDDDGVPSWWRDHVGTDWKPPVALTAKRDVIRTNTAEQPLVAKVEYIGRHSTEKAIGAIGQRALTESTGALDMSKLYALLDQELVRV